MKDMAEVADAEEALRTAMLAGDVATLSALIDDALVFTGVDGSVLTKSDDLAAHERGMLKIARLDLSDRRLHAIGDLVLATTKAELAGTFGGAAIAGAFAYTRLWSRASGRWRVVAGHAGRIG